LVSYVDFLDRDGHYSDWLNATRNWCEKSVGHTDASDSASLFNAMRIPFPLHMTICRFNRKLSYEEQAQLWSVANRCRSIELGRMLVEETVLTVARETPYRKIREVRRFSVGSS